VTGLFDFFPDPCGDFGGAESNRSLDVKGTDERNFRSQKEWHSRGYYRAGNAHTKFIVAVFVDLQTDSPN
jgi:hypothetical protein